MSALGSVSPMDNFVERLWPIAIVTLLAVIFYAASHKSESSIPLLNPKKPFELSDRRVKDDFVAKARDMVRCWFQTNPSKAMRMIGDAGEVTVLPPEMAQEIRNDKRLSFAQWTFRSFHGHLPGFDGARQGTNGSNLVQNVVTKDLTKQLAKVTQPLAEETAMALDDLFTNQTVWHSMQMKEVILPLVARISSRVFLGPELCRNEAWLRISREYTVTIFEAATELRLWPKITRPFVHWFLRRCRNLRAQVAEATQIIESTIAARRKLQQQCESEGRPSPEYNDAIDWFEQTAKGSYDPVGSQLSLSLAAIHTTTDLLCQVLTRVAENPEILKPLREEIVSVLKAEGWKKTSLYNMKLLDSVIKESQRLKPTEIASMFRLTLEDIKLSDGTVIPANHGLAVSSHKLWDENVYSNPDQWDGYRFYKMRDEPGKQNVAQLVATGPENLAFGHGVHACPGRFFASNEIKIALVQIIMKYDWELVDPPAQKIIPYGFTLNGNPFIEMRIKRRQPEFDIDSLTEA